MAILKLLLDHGPVNDPHFDCEDIRHSAFAKVLRLGNVEAVRLFIEYGASIAPNKDARKLSAIHLAASNDDLNVLKLIFDSGLYHVDHTVGSGQSPLVVATIIGNLECIRFLVEKGANINIVNWHGNSLLCLAAAYGQIKAFGELLKLGAEVNTMTSQHQTILEYFAPYEYGVVPGKSVDIADSIREHLLMHLAKLEALNRPVSDRDYKSIGEDELLQDYFEVCRAELAHMEECIIDGSVTFFDILTKPDIGAYVRNEHVVDTFKLQDIAGYFPNYHELLKERFSEELKRQELMKDAVNGMSRILPFDTETFHCIFYNIFRFIENEDLRNLKVIGN